MSLDTTGGPEPERRSLDREDWVTTPRFVVGGALAVLGVVVVAVGGLAPGELLSTVTVAQALFAGATAVVLGAVVALSGYRLTTRQQQYLVRADRELREIRSYLSAFEDIVPDATERATAPTADDPGEADGVNDAESVPGTEGGESGDGPGDADGTDGSAGPDVRRDLPSPRELRSRLEQAEQDLLKARRAVYRRDYSTFLSLFYEASRQEILLYDYLDGPAEGWAFGLGGDGNDAREVDAAAATGPGPHRRWNLSRRIRSFAGDSLSGQSLRLVREYLDGSDSLPTSWELYYAVRVLHEWNVGRHERALEVKRFLRFGVSALSLVLFGLVVVLPRAFPGGLVGQFGNGTGNGSVPAGEVAAGVVTNDLFLVLVLLAGALGAVFSMVLRSFGDFYTLTTDPSVPEPVFMLEALLARTLVGGVSALVLFFVARSDFGEVVLAADLLTSPAALLLLGFAAGLSERLVKRSLGEVVESVGGEDSGVEWPPERRRSGGGGAGGPPPGGPPSGGAERDGEGARPDEDAGEPADRPPAREETEEDADGEGEIGEDASGGAAEEPSDGERRTDEEDGEADGPPGSS